MEKYPQKEKYISLMEKALSAYTDEHIQAYFDRVKKEGLTEHGFPRLTVNMGILLCHGKRSYLLPLFCEMMDFCCENIPKVKAANDFSVKEVVFCLMELERTKLVSQERIDGWKELLKTINPETCYNIFARKPDDKVFNWAAFSMVSEHMRQYIGLCDSSEFVNTQIPSQLQWLDENGMYRDAYHHPPMVYDLVTRALFAVLLHFGYRGRYYEEIDNCLRKAGVMTLKMQSVTGEIPFGGRSNQCAYTEAQAAILFEYEARRYAAEGNMELAARFKKGVAKALGNMEMWLSRTTLRHIKNYFPIETKYGCEGYAYFDKYMITAASFLYAAYLVCDPSLEPAEVEDDSPMVLRTSEVFHKLFLRSGEYFLEFDTDADPKYDSTGLGRVHRKGAPSQVCLSIPCPASPAYKLNRTDAINLSLCPGVKAGDEWIFAADGQTKYEVVHLKTTQTQAYTHLSCRFPESKCVEAKYTVSEDGVDVVLEGKEELAHMLPAFHFDGENYSEITLNGNCLEIAYMGWICRYTADSEILDTGKIGCNRNGYYRAFYTTGNKALHLKIEIIEQ